MGFNFNIGNYFNALGRQNWDWRKLPSVRDYNRPVVRPGQPVQPVGGQRSTWKNPDDEGAQPQSGALQNAWQNPDAIYNAPGNLAQQSLIARSVDGQRILNERGQPSQDFVNRVANARTQILRNPGRYSPEDFKAINSIIDKYESLAESGYQSGLLRDHTEQLSSIKNSMASHNAIAPKPGEPSTVIDEASGEIRVIPAPADKSTGSGGDGARAPDTSSTAPTAANLKGVNWGELSEKERKLLQAGLEGRNFDCGNFGIHNDGVDGKIGKVTRGALAQHLKATGYEGALDAKAILSHVQKTPGLDASKHQALLERNKLVASGPTAGPTRSA